MKENRTTNSLQFCEFTYCHRLARTRRASCNIWNTLRQAISNFAVSNDQSRAPNALQAASSRILIDHEVIDTDMPGKNSVSQFKFVDGGNIHLLETIFSGIMMMLKKLCVTHKGCFSLNWRMMALQTLSLGSMA